MNTTLSVEKIVETRDLEYQFTDLELQEMGKDLSERVIDHVKTELEKKEITKTYSDSLKAKMKVIKQLSYKIDNGAEIRDVSCEVRPNDPVYGKKTIVRQDTLESWVEDMSTEEFNLFNQELPVGDSESYLPWDEEE